MLKNIAIQFVIYLLNIVEALYRGELCGHRSLVLANLSDTGKPEMTQYA
jgi:hypothetical protein